MLICVRCCGRCADWVELGTKGRLGIGLLDRNGTTGVKMMEV